MPPTLTYPGVYIVEAPSGVHTITGVATSIAAFFGQASMGQLNTPIQCLSYSDYTRNLGAPVPGANLAQSVQEFFSNGGSECYVVRLAHGAQPAQVGLTNRAGTPVLTVMASSPGIWGAGLSVTVDYNTPMPDSTFNLQVMNTVNGSVVQTQTFANLSMDPASPRYAPNFVSQSSSLIQLAPAAATTTTFKGYSEARAMVNVPTDGFNAAIAALWPSSDQGSFQISVDGSPWATVNLSKTKMTTGLGGTTDLLTFSYIYTSIKSSFGPGFDVTLQRTPGNFLQVQSNASGATSSVQIQPGDPTSDLARPLMLGVAQGGIEVASYAELRPIPTGIYFDPNSPSTTGEIMPAVDTLAAVTLADVQSISINGSPAVTIPWSGGGATPFSQGAGGASDHDGVRQNLQTIAGLINTSFPGFQAGVAGYRLFVQNLNPLPAPGADTITFTTNADANDFKNGFASTVAAYPLGTPLTGIGYASAGPAPTDGTPPLQADYTGSELSRSGFWALDAVDLFNLMVIPGDGISTSGEWDVIRAAAAQYCQSRRAFLILDAPAEWSINSLSNAQSLVQTFRSPLGNSDINCAVYFPRVQINDNGILRLVGPSGMVAGMYAATDAARGVWKAPAGTQAALNGVIDLELILTDKQNGVLNPLAVNCLRRMPAGYLIWGARTVAGFDNSGDSDWTYVPVRRTALFLEESLYRGTQWVVFEPNDEPLWAQIRMNIGAFMMGLFRQGAFQGATPDQAFFVKCDSETTTQADIDQGIVNIIVGFAPLKPAEFVVITIQQIAGDLT